MHCSSNKASRLSLRKAVRKCRRRKTGENIVDLTVVQQSGICTMCTSYGVCYTYLRNPKAWTQAMHKHKSNVFNKFWNHPYVAAALLYNLVYIHDMYTMASHSGTYCLNMSESMFQSSDSATWKRALQNFSKQNKAKQACKSGTQSADRKICHYQDSCNRPECHFVHLPSRYLSEKKKPYKVFPLSCPM